MAELQHQRAILLQSANAFPLPPGMKFSYGTAGFRAKGSNLASTVFRTGVLAALRSLTMGGATVGLMITASHNPVCDNGVKVADPSGGMMTQRWEPFADAIASSPTTEDLVQLVFDFAREENIPLGTLLSAEVLLGRDTRPSGETLLEAAKQGIAAVSGAVAIDMGVLTTPQLHWMVRCKNKRMKASESDYYTQLSSSFKQLLDLIPKETAINAFDTTVLVDGANGVGGEKLMQLKKMLPGLDIHVRNVGKNGEGILNEGVGADFVQKEKVIPHGFNLDDAGRRCASLDGDADRLVYFSISAANGKKINLIDGDKILSLFALFIQEQLSILKKDEFKGMTNDLHVNLGIVQTAYANGASTDFLRQLGMEVAFTPTGVKYLHEKASEYDIGIYFEANGHGTILFSEQFIQGLENLNFQLTSNSPGSKQTQLFFLTFLRHLMAVHDSLAITNIKYCMSGSDCQKAALRLLSASQLINQAVGDALSGLLLVEAILRHMGWTIDDWNKLYEDLPSRQLKVKVVDRSSVVTSNAETQVVRPPGLQEVIDTETAKHSHGRCFVRPSGTEDVVRVYAEASTQEAADALAQSVAKEIDRFLGFHSSH